MESSGDDGKLVSSKKGPVVLVCGGKDGTIVDPTANTTKCD